MRLVPSAALLASLACLALTSLAPRAAALCAAPPPQPVRLVAPADTLPSGAGIVVALGDAERLERPRLVHGSRPTTLGVETVAAGLVVLRASSPPAPGRYELQGVLPTPLTIEITADALPAPPPAPRLASIRHVEQSVDRGPRSYTSARVEARVQGDAPSGVVLLATSWAQDGTDQSAWAGAASDPIVLFSIGRCSGYGRYAPRAGTRVTARWVDRFGQLSPPSAPVLVAR